MPFGYDKDYRDLTTALRQAIRKRGLPTGNTLEQNVTELSNRGRITKSDADKLSLLLKQSFDIANAKNTKPPTSQYKEDMEYMVAKLIRLIY